MTDIDQASDWLYNAKKVLIFTGAGVSAESGIPTFRDQGGLWAGFSAADLASLTGFDKDPCQVWAWYEMRRQRVRQAEPNAAHRAVATYAKERPGVSVITQNVDDLHQRAAVAAGDDDPTIISYHGSLFRMRCRRCSLPGDMPHVIDTTSRDTLPTCRQCGKFMRPDITWFGEAIHRKVADDSDQLSSRADVCLVIGTSLEVYPAAFIPKQVLAHGGHVIEINPEPETFAHPEVVQLRGTACEFVPDVLRDTRYARVAP